MYESSEFSYRDFTETLDLEDRFDTLLFTHEIIENGTESIEKNSIPVTEGIISPVKNNLLLSCNDSGQHFSIGTESITELNTQNCQNDINIASIVPIHNSFYDESTLLDENIVDQFLIPTPTSSNSNEDDKNNGPDILALFSCVICHDIFTTDADLLDHTILMHASINLSASETGTTCTNSELQDTSSITNFDAEWLVCCICERVLSMALEIEPNEQLCCLDAFGKGCVGSRKLDAMFVCDVCNYLFADGEALDRHKLTCTRKNELNEQTPPESLDLSCTYCGQEFPTEIELRNHEDSHRETRPHRTYKRSSDSKMWNCGSCNQLFATARELYRHKRGEDRPPGTPLMAYVCEECDKVLGSMCALHTHKKMHKVIKPGFPCKICGRRFNQSGHLAIHMRMHTGERPYPCDLCPKAFKVKVERDDHRRTHTGERPFACNACPKTFTAAARLREHARIHTDQRPYICDICGAAFRRPYARTVHTLIHTGQKPHECDVCGTAFRRSGDMWKHKRTLHGIQPTDLAN
ncbi:zinc finger protein 883-like isoform X1 [Pieris napi]|uniref:zinc finger protein 883-like isoform X1 n=3 Tax=Pieris napi TaxID=78633 RepID=UPI001FB86D5E|nr:zinc finger protein 883-like isoform X1 [Pieris napi]